MLQKLQTKRLHLHAVQYWTHQASSFTHLKTHNSRAENNNNHLIISESIQTPACKNKEQQMGGETQGLRAFLQMAGEQRKSKGEKEKQHKGTFILLTRGAWLSSHCHWNYFRTGLTPLHPIPRTEHGHITAFRGQNPLPATDTSLSPETWRKTSPTTSSQQNKGSL